MEMPGETWEARTGQGDRILFGDGLRGEVLEQGEFGERTIRFAADGPVREVLEKLGEMPLPPYIQRKPDEKDRERYQTVYAAEKGSIAAPTAGLHFTEAMLERCREAGAEIAEVTLHVGLGTLRAGARRRVERHPAARKYCSIAGKEAETMRRAKRRFCVGTTSVRTVETAMFVGEFVQAMEGKQPVHLPGLPVS